MSSNTDSKGKSEAVSAGAGSVDTIRSQLSNADAVYQLAQQAWAEACSQIEFVQDSLKDNSIMAWLSDPSIDQGALEEARRVGRAAYMALGKATSARKGLEAALTAALDTAGRQLEGGRPFGSGDLSEVASVNTTGSQADVAAGFRPEHGSSRPENGATADASMATAALANIPVPLTPSASLVIPTALDVLNPLGISEYEYMVRYLGVSKEAMKLKPPTVEARFGPSSKLTIREFLLRVETSLLTAMVPRPRWTRLMLNYFDCPATQAMMRALITDDATYDDMYQRIVKRFESSGQVTQMRIAHQKIVQQLNESVYDYAVRYRELTARACIQPDCETSIHHFAISVKDEFSDALLNKINIEKMQAHPLWSLQDFIDEAKKVEDMRALRQSLVAGRGGGGTTKQRAGIGAHVRCFATLANGQTCNGNHYIRQHRDAIDGATVRGVTSFEPKRRTIEEYTAFLKTDGGKRSMIGKACHHCNLVNHLKPVCPWVHLPTDQAITAAKGGASEASSSDVSDIPAVRLVRGVDFLVDSNSAANDEADVVEGDVAPNMEALDDEVLLSQ